MADILALIRLAERAADDLQTMYNRAGSGVFRANMGWAVDNFATRLVPMFRSLGQAVDLDPNATFDDGRSKAKAFAEMGDLIAKNAEQLARDIEANRGGQFLSDFIKGFPAAFRTMWKTAGDTLPDLPTNLVWALLKPVLLAGGGLIALVWLFGQAGGSVNTPYVSVGRRRS